MTTVRLAASPGEVQAAYAVRAAVFVDEQQVPVELERDDADPTADHLVAVEAGTVVGTARLVVEPPGFEDTDPALGRVGHLGRLAVLPRARGSGLGVTLVRAIEHRAGERGLRVMVLSAQTYAEGFYERLGYTAYGAVFDDAGIDHCWMRREL